MSAQINKSYEERIIREQACEAEARAYFFALVPQVTAALGEGWTIEEPASEDRQEMRRVFTGPTQPPGNTISFSLFLATGWAARPHKDGRRLYARSRYTHPGPKLEARQPPSRDSHEIGMDWKKNPAQIAKQIKNRLFPDYLPELLSWRERVSARLANLDAGTQARAQIEAATGHKGYQLYHGQEWRLEEVGVSHRDGYGDGSFEFRESGLTAAQIIRLCAALVEPEGGR